MAAASAAAARDREASAVAREATVDREALAVARAVLVAVRVVLEAATVREDEVDEAVTVKEVSAKEVMARVVITRVVITREVTAGNKEDSEVRADSDKVVDSDVRLSCLLSD